MSNATVARHPKLDLILKEFRKDPIKFLTRNQMYYGAQWNPVQIGWLFRLGSVNMGTLRVEYFEACPTQTDPPGFPGNIPAKVVETYFENFPGEADRVLL